ncbi:hypothetical protein D6779_07180 [Candidatus Parcubacteria bacterium]|nr:MAG: hypothetical protein D6779_07180 [Candidatus Parcubacteria bacterium]
MASFWIGTFMAGKVDSLGDESIQTKFIMLGLPAIPLESIYCLKDTVRRVVGIPIGLYPRSVAAAYLRWWFGGGALVMIYMGLSSGRGDLLAYGMLAGVTAVSTIWLGRLTPRERKRRQILASVVGIGAPPRWLPAGIVYETKPKLEKAWKQSRYGEYHEDWRSVSVRSVPNGLLPLLFCLALYQGERQFADKVWEVIEERMEE